jgi:hypothetical protein
MTAIPRDDAGAEAGLPVLRFALPPLMAGAEFEIGAPALVLTATDGRKEPTYYVYPVPETTIETESGPRRATMYVNPGPAYARVLPRGGNPNCFVRWDDPYISQAEVIHEVDS